MSRETDVLMRVRFYLVASIEHGQTPRLSLDVALTSFVEDTRSTTSNAVSVRDLGDADGSATGTWCSLRVSTA
jgi:hypothetical protein